MLYAAGILLFVTLSFYAYRVGMHRGTDSANARRPPPASTEPASLEAQLSDAGHERQIARAQIEQRDKTIAELRQQLSSADGGNQWTESSEGPLGKRSATATRQDLVQQRTELAQKLDAAQSSSQALQQKLDALDQQSAQEAARAKALDTKVNDLTRLLHDREGH